MEDTILAVSSPPGRGALAILRWSGPAAHACLRAIVRGGALPRSDPSPRIGSVALSVGGFSIEAAVHVHTAPRSYTGEDLVELFLPGSPLLVGAVFRALLAVAAREGLELRPALSGEFTLRAFREGRMDLSQAEGVAAIIAARGEAEARASRRVLRGELGDRLRAVREAIIEALASLEATLDFPDEDLPAPHAEGLLALVRKAVDSLRGLRRSTAFRIPEEGVPRVALWGFPGAGKSSLLNAIVGRPAAIVGPLGGTTRDPIRAVGRHGERRVEWIDLPGSFEPWNLSRASDPTFAGSLRGGGTDALEAVLSRMTRIELEHVDRVLWVLDATAPFGPSLAAYRRLGVPGKTLVAQKIDAASPGAIRELSALEEAPILVSAKAVLGLSELVDRVLLPREVGLARGVSTEPVFLSSARQEALLSEADAALARAVASLEGGEGLEYPASDLRDALAVLDGTLGDSSAGAVLDLVFSRFCIGK